jgi:hypothetical protein
MERIQLRRTLKYAAGAVQLYRQDLEAIVHEFSAPMLIDGVATPRHVVLYANIDGRPRDVHFTHRTSSLDELQAALGPKVQTAPSITVSPGDLNFDYHPILGVHLQGTAPLDELPYHRVVDLLRRARRWSWPFFQVSAWVYALALLIAILACSPPQRAWRDAAKWALLMTLGGIVISQAQWGMGHRCAIYLIHRHERSAERSIFRRETIWRMVPPLLAAC